MSRNASELDSASLHKEGVTMLPEQLKSVIAGEATPLSNRRTPRGDCRQRTGKEKSRNLRGPAWDELPCRESDDLIVARTGLINRERRGLTVSVQLLETNATA